MMASGRRWFLAALFVVLGCEMKRGEREIVPGLTWQLLDIGESRIVHHGRVVASGNIMIEICPPYLVGYVSGQDGSSFYIDLLKDRFARFTSELELPKALRADFSSRKCEGRDTLYCAEAVMGPYGAMARDEFAGKLRKLRDCLGNLKLNRNCDIGNVWMEP